MRVLVIEDDERVASFIVRGLHETANTPQHCLTGRDGLAMALAFRFDAILLDIKLGDMDGVDLVRELRRRGCDTPVLALTARSMIEDRVAGLDAGCDDYLVKPFAFDELLARLRALTRRDFSHIASLTTYHGLTIDPIRRSVTRDGRLIHLSNRELLLLSVLMAWPERVFPRGEIMERVWGSVNQHSSNVLEVYIRQLRRKIDNGFSCPLLRTVRGVGYCLRADAP